MIYIALFYAADEKRLDQLARSINDNSGFQTADTVEGLAADKGQGYVLSYRSSALAPGSTQAIQIKTSTTATVAIKEETIFASDGTFTLQFYEDPVMSSGTTTINIINRQRRLYLDDPTTYTAQTIAYSNPSTISGGTLLISKHWHSGTNVNPNNVSNIEGIGWQLGKGHNYVYKFINLDTTSTIDYTINLAIYELPEARE